MAYSCCLRPRKRLLSLVDFFRWDLSCYDVTDDVTDDVTGWGRHSRWSRSTTGRVWLSTGPTPQSERLGTWWWSAAADDALPASAATASNLPPPTAGWLVPAPGPRRRRHGPSATGWRPGLDACTAAVRRPWNRESLSDPTSMTSSRPL